MGGCLRGRDQASQAAALCQTPAGPGSGNAMLVLMVRTGTGGLGRSEF